MPFFSVVLVLLWEILLKTIPQTHRKLFVVAEHLLFAQTVSLLLHNVLQYSGSVFEEMYNVLAM